MAAERMTHRRVLAIAVPMVISNATIPLLGAVDTGVIGQLGEAAPIGAVGIGAAILTAIYWFFGFLRMGTVGLASQANGAGDVAESDAILSRVLMIGAAGGLGVIALQVPLFFAAFRLAPASGEVEALARGYMAIRVWSAPAAIALYGIFGWLIAAERARAVLVLQVLSNGCNILLDVIFVLQMGWGIEGVAWATFLSEWAALGFGLWLCRAAFGRPGWLDKVRVFDRAKLVRMAAVNGDILIRTAVLQAIPLSFLFLSSGIGDTTLAANQILYQFLIVSAFALDGFAFAAESLVGRSMGARRPDLIRQCARLVGMWSMGIAAVMALGIGVFGPALIDIMTPAEAIRGEARLYVVYLAVTPVFGAVPWMLDGIFIGATRTRDMRNMALVSGALYIAAVLLLVPAFANDGLWLALLFSYVARGVTLALRYPALEAAA